MKFPSPTGDARAVTGKRVPVPMPMPMPMPERISTTSAQRAHQRQRERVRASVLLRPDRSSDERSGG